MKSLKAWVHFPNIGKYYSDTVQKLTPWGSRGPPGGQHQEVTSRWRIKLRGRTPQKSWPTVMLDFETYAENEAAIRSCSDTIENDVENLLNNVVNDDDNNSNALRELWVFPDQMWNLQLRIQTNQQLKNTRLKNNKKHLPVKHVGIIIGITVNFNNIQYFMGEKWF